VWFAGLINNPTVFLKKFVDWLQGIRLKTPSAVRWLLGVLVIVVLLVAISYWTIHPGVGENKWITQSISVVTLIVITLAVWLKPIRFRLLEWLGVYSYEIYLLHWPLLYRYDFILGHLPAGLGVATALVWIFGVSVLLRYVTNLIGNISFKPRL
jgi:peptidoglycan/LPS O-acetylase OafA/YrhL